MYYGAVRGGGAAVRRPAPGLSDGQEEVGKEENIAFGKVEDAGSSSSLIK